MVAPTERQQRETDNNRPVQPRRILIADDDAATRNMLVELLRGEGYDTLEAKSGGQVAASDANVLIIGETGAGKESVAEMLHEYSTHSKGPLIKVNLTALPATLMESELFGHEKGSFTGADRQRVGRFEMAHKGTIFLDEIGEDRKSV